ncbi:MAG: HmuY family protein [Chitinophagales bacterium]
MLSKSIFLFLAVLILASCEKEELPIEKTDRGGVISSEVFINSNYQYQIWYDLEENKTVKKSLKTDWDIAFDCSGENAIYLNSSLAMRAANTGSKDFENSFDKNTLNFRGDHNSGIRDSLALKNWNSGNVYLLDLGYTPEGNERGFVKIQFLGENNGTYTFKYAKDGESAREAKVSKNTTYNRVGFSIENDSEILFEPPKDQFDLLFSQYTHVFYEPYTPYLVTGVLLNTNNTMAYCDSVNEFGAITIENVNETLFANQKDAIGYDWKEIDFTSANAVFITDMSKNYILKTRSAFLFKLHFIDFYTSKGEKGNFVFEYQRL